MGDDYALPFFNVELNNYSRVCKDKIKVYIDENGELGQHKLDWKAKTDHW